MPIYEYECKNCGTRFEKMQPITSDPIKLCPNCGEEKVRRVIQPVGVIFKGSGWYINDNRKSTSESLPAASKSDSTGESSKSETKSDSKSDSPASPPSDSGGKADSAPSSKAE